MRAHEEGRRAKSVDVVHDKMLMRMYVVTTFFNLWGDFNLVVREGVRLFVLYCIVLYNDYMMVLLLVKLSMCVL